MALAPAFTGAGIAVETPTRQARERGLFSAANMEPLPAHGELGLFYQTDGIYPVEQVELSEDECLAAAALTPEGYDFVRGTPVILYAAVECTGFNARLEDFAEDAQARLTAGEERALEKFLWTEVLPKGDDEHPAGALSTKRAVGLLETVAGEQYSYEPTLHFGRDLAIDLLGERILKVGDPNAFGARAVNGAGYVGKAGPSGTAAAAGTEWLYITGQVTIWQSDVNVYQAFDTTTNKMYAVAMRRDVVAIDGFTSAARVTLDQ